jgi:hypothetical protein
MARESAPMCAPPGQALTKNRAEITAAPCRLVRPSILPFPRLSTTRIPSSKITPKPHGSLKKESHGGAPVDCKGGSRSPLREVARLSVRSGAAPIASVIPASISSCASSRTRPDETASYAIDSSTVGSSRALAAGFELLV